MRIESAFDRAEGFVENRAEHFSHERAADKAVAVFAGECAAEFEHKIGNVIGDGLEFAHAVGRLHVDDGANVEAADGGVGVDAGRVSCLRMSARKRSMKSRSFSGATAVSSTNESDLASSFIVMESPSAASRRLQTRACWAGSARERNDSRSRAARDPVRGGEAGRQIFFRGRRRTRCKQRAGLAFDEGLAHALQVGAEPGVIEDEAVHDFDRRGLMAQDQRRGVEGFE